MNRRSKISIIAGAGITLAALGAARYLVYSLTKPARLQISENPSDYDLNYENVAFPAAHDGLTIKGWYIPAENRDRCIIITHGGRSHRADSNIGILAIARELVNRGYNVLTFDLRGHGESDDGRMTGGYYEKRDLQGAIAHVNERGIPARNIGLLGYSLGGATSLLAAAENEDLPAVVCDSSWADIAELTKSQLKRRTYMPAFLSFLMPGMFKAAYGIDIAAVRPLDAVRYIAPRPVFFIHGQIDEIVPVASALRLYHSIQNPLNRLWIVPEANHTGSFRARPGEYTTKIADFFDQYI